MKDLTSQSKQELNEFFNSFDWVLTDGDGVLWDVREAIPGASDGINSLKTIGKKIALVSNNSTRTLDDFLTKLKSSDVQIERENIIHPTQAIVSYLRKQNFNKEIHLIGMGAIRKELEAAGFKISSSSETTPISETIQELTSNALMKNDNVAAVVTDLDINLTYIKMQRALTFLNNPEVLFVSGSTEIKLPFYKNHFLIGPGGFLDVLQKISERKALVMAKPSPLFWEFVVGKLGIRDRSRVLFIGDTVLEDMAFATNAGFKKLLVLSGLVNKKSLLEWPWAEEYKPDLYADSLKTVHDIIEQHLKQ